MLTKQSASEQVKLVPTGGTEALDQIIDRSGFEGLRNGDLWDRNILQTEGPMAFLTVEVDMEIVVLVVMMAMAEFVADAVAGVVENVHQVRLAEGL